MDDPSKRNPEVPEARLAELRQADDSTRRQVALLTSIVSIFRETATCQSEEELAQVCLGVAEELTGSAYGFIGEINESGLFNTTMVSEAGWKACQVPRPQADQLLRTCRTEASTGSASRSSGELSRHLHQVELRQG